MNLKRNRFPKITIPVFSLAFVLLILISPRMFRQTSSASGTPHKVYVAFGFHGNLYHSFRGDSNDENGFGQDIQIIRHTLRVLDRFNSKGVPVSAAWDFDNLFSLEEILPKHAPDIIDTIRIRVAENKDEVLLMSYNNGMTSAMTDREFMTSMRRAISNEQGSGVRDIFGKVAPVVRPQEMMTTPGQFGRYNALGIPYMALYYSATSFDAFRMFSRRLQPSEAYNPLTYRNPDTGEKMIIIPTYHPGDLVENVSLRDWVEKLHRLQKEGEIDRDVLLFINFDADAAFWSGVSLPWYLKWLPNTGGLSGLIESVAGLKYVSFTRLSEYLKTHEPAGTVSFGQDTADGSFNGYHSWAEKSCVSDYWTRIVRNRRAHELAEKVSRTFGADVGTRRLQHLLAESFELRMRALSTTNFGLAGPFLARQREAVMDRLLKRLDASTGAIVSALASVVSEKADENLPQDTAVGKKIDTFVYLQRTRDAGTDTGDRLFFTIPAKEGIPDRYRILCQDGRTIQVVVEKKEPVGDGRNVNLVLRTSGKEKMADGWYHLYALKSKAHDDFSPSRQIFADGSLLKNRFITVRIDENGHLIDVSRNGVRQLDAGSLLPSIRYRGRRLAPDKLSLTVEASGGAGVASIRLQGPWRGPKGRTRAPGWIDYRIRLLQGVPYLFVDGAVRYPDTVRSDLLRPEKPVLARKVDLGWEEVAPLELRFSQTTRKQHPFTVHKRNFLGVENDYSLDYFRHSEKNLNLASANNHITSEYVAIAAKNGGMAVAMNTDILANFAFCPLRMTYREENKTFAIRANPFGTYDGKQMHPPTGGNGLGYKAVLLSAPQFHSAAPTYNGRTERFELMVAFFQGDKMSDGLKRDLISFARPSFVLGTHHLKTVNLPPVASLPPAGFFALPYRDGVLCQWEETENSGKEYLLHLRDSAGRWERSFTVSGTTRYIPSSELPRVVRGDKMIATVRRISASSGDDFLPLSATTVPQTGKNSVDPDIPNGFKARVFQASVGAWLERNLL